jgi:membrane protein
MGLIFKRNFMIKAIFNKSNFKNIWLVMQSALKNFKLNDPLRIAASTAFFATFAILVVILQIFGIFINRREFGGNIIGKLSQLVGEKSATEIAHILTNMYRLGEIWYSTLLIFLFLIFVSTTLFIIIRNSINQLWNIKVKDNLGFSFHLKQRAKSLGIISIGGFLMIFVFTLEAIRIYLQKKFDYEPSIAGFVNELIFFVITSVWFAIAYRFIANARPVWKTVLIASAFTGILFTIGKVIMKSLLINSNIDQIYGTSGAILLVMLFVFYSSLIFYYGACLVNAISELVEKPISVSNKAYKFRLEEIKEKNI